jgi:hypothetical protein
MFFLNQTLEILFGFIGVALLCGISLLNFYGSGKLNHKAHKEKQRKAAKALCELRESLSVL